MAMTVQSIITQVQRDAELNKPPAKHSPKAQKQGEDVAVSVFIILFNDVPSPIKTE